jgi:hypothetical protein
VRTLKISKVDAAQRQVDTAIQIFFDDGDPVSIHTLLYAAHDIVHGLHKRITGKPLFFDNDAVKGIPGLIRIIKDWPNFFKHGRLYELDRTLEFNPECNLVFFSACITGLDSVCPGRSDLQHAMVYWLLIHHPEYFPAASLRHRPSGELLKQAKRLGKKGFLQAYIRGKRRWPPK